MGLAVTFAQALGQMPPVPEYKAYERTEVVKVDSMAKSADLYRAAKRWFADTFKDAKAVIQLEDTTTHTIVGKGNFPLVWEGDSKDGRIDFTVEVMTKDGRYRVRFYDLGHFGSPKVFGTTFYPATNLGTVYEGEQCYRPEHMWSGEKRMLKEYSWVAGNCKEIVWPQVNASIEGMLLTLKATMTNATAPPSKGKTPSDW